VLIWTLRILLPIILFCIYFKVQSPKDDQIPGPTGQVYSRRELMEQRKTVGLDWDAPEGIDGITLKDPTQAPALFASAPRSAARPAHGAGGRRGDGERGGGRERGDRRERRGPGAGAGVAERRPAPEKAEDEATLAEKRAAQEKMHLESLLNFVAFNPSYQQRFFLPDEEVQPPPPPKKRPRGAPAPLIGSSLESGILCSANIAVSGEATEKANSEAQMVLAGAIKFKRSDVARSLHSQLADAQVEISEKTYALMIEASVLARDLRSASDFLMKMESSGFCPDSKLLDKVMDLYSLQKSAREQEKRQAAAAQKQQVAPLQQQCSMEAPVAPTKTPMEALESVLGPHISSMAVQEDTARSKLSSQAAVFVPSFGVPPPPPKPLGATGDATLEPAALAADTLSAPDVPAVVPEGAEMGMAWLPGEEAMQEDYETGFGVYEASPPQRTRLTASAEPFRPSFGLPFDPNMGGWSDDAWAAEVEDVPPKSRRAQGQGGVKKKGKENKQESSGPKDAKAPGTGSKEPAAKAKAAKAPPAQTRASGETRGSGGKQVWKPKKVEQN